MSRPSALSVCVHHAGPSQLAAGRDLATVRRIRDGFRSRVETLIGSLA